MIVTCFVLARRFSGAWAIVGLVCGALFAVGLELGLRHRRPPRMRRAKELTMDNKGPASYFPSIEKKYGQPISYWIDLIHANTQLTRHGELVTWLKQDHGLGHGHATALVGHALQNRP